MVNDEQAASAQIIFPESERGLDLCLDGVSGQLTGLRPEYPLLLSDFRIIKPSDCRQTVCCGEAVRSAIQPIPATAWLLVNLLQTVVALKCAARWITV